MSEHYVIQTDGYTAIGVMKQFGEVLWVFTSSLFGPEERVVSFSYEETRIKSDIKVKDDILTCELYGHRKSLLIVASED